MVVAKLVMPEQFEDMPMHDLRELVLERSTMHTYLRGEMIEILPYDVAIILEGFVKQEGKDEFTTAPAVLVPSQAENNLANAGSRQTIQSPQGIWYQADTRSRIIIFDMSSMHNESHLHRDTASFLSQSIRIPGCLSHEHEDLVSFPDKQLHKGKPKKTVAKYASDPGFKRLSEKAMQLSMFGSMDMGKKYSAREGRFLRLLWSTGLQSSKSYTSIQSQIGKFFSSSALLSTQSQQGTAMRRRLKSQGCIPSTGAGPFSIVPHPRAIVWRAADDSSEGSDAEDEHIVRIDSPSNLFHNQFPH